MIRTITTFVIAMLFTTAMAQQPLKNTAFKDGEQLEYKLYFNWKFIWLTAGTAKMSIKAATYQGKPAYCCALTTETSKKIDRYFRMRDTLLCYTTPECLPLYYRKGASEGKRYYVRLENAHTERCKRYITGRMCGKKGNRKYNVDGFDLNRIQGGRNAVV